MIWGFFLCCFQAMKGPLGSQMVLNGQACVPWEVKINILLWDDFTMGILSITHLRGGQRDIWWFEAFCLPFSGTEGPLRAPEGPQWFSMDKLVCLEVEINYFTMGWFHYGNTKSCSLERWAKGYLWLEVFCLLFSGTEGPLKGPLTAP